MFNIKFLVVFINEMKMFLFFKFLVWFIILKFWGEVRGRVYMECTYEMACVGWYVCIGW